MEEFCFMVKKDFSAKLNKFEIDPHSVVCMFLVMAVKLIHAFRGVKFNKPRTVSLF